MMISKTENKSVISLLLVGSLFMLTGCLGEKEKPTKIVGEEVNELQNVSNSGTTGNLGTAGNSGKGEVLLTIDGKPVLYSDDYEDQKLMAQQSNQQLNMILQMIPDAEFNMLFKSIEAGHLMKEWVLRSGIDQKPELIKQRRQYHEAIDLQLYMKYYEDAHPIHVSNEEAEAYYNAKRDQMPGLILSPASVDIVYAKFTTKAAAENFAGKVRDGSEKHFKLASKEADVKTENMVVKSDDANVSESLKNSVLAATKFPSKEIVKIDDNSYWVVGMLRKKDVEYRSFETPEVKQGITKMCRDEKREVELTKQIEQLNSQYNVVENKSYFENKKQNQANALKKAEQIVLQAQQQNTNDAALDMTDNKI